MLCMSCPSYPLYQDSTCWWELVVSLLVIFPLFLLFYFFWNTCSLCSSLRMRGQVLCPYKLAFQVLFLEQVLEIAVTVLSYHWILMPGDPLQQVRSLELRLKDKLCSSRSKIFPAIKRGALVDVYLTTSGNGVTAHQNWPSGPALLVPQK